MPRLLALEWDSREARVVVANVRGGEATFEEAFAVELAPRDANSASDIGARLAAAIEARHLGKVETLLAVGRANIELKRLSVPPAPDAELPELVRFQAVQEFHALADDWPLDFIPPTGSADAPRSVLAAAIAPEVVAQSLEACAAAGLKPKRMVLRPCAAASLVFRQSHASAGLRLLVDCLAEEVDLTVLDDQAVIFTRTVRSTIGAVRSTIGIDPNAVPALVGELRRTLAAVQHQAGVAVAGIDLCGAADEYVELAAAIESQLKLPVRFFQPLADARLAGPLARQLPPRSGRFAPLVGLLLDEAEGMPHAIDFLNPHRPPAPPSRRRSLALAGTGAALLALFVGGWVWSESAALDDEIERLAARSAELDRLVKRSADIERNVAELDRWAASDVVWLDVLARLSEKFPPAPDAQLSRFRAVPLNEGGRLDLEGAVRTSQLIDELEARLRDRRHRVEGQESQQDAAASRYRWRFKASVEVAPGEEREPAAKSAPAPKQLPKSVTKQPTAPPAEGAR